MSKAGRSTSFLGRLGKIWQFHRRYRKHFVIRAIYLGSYASGWRQVRHGSPEYHTAPYNLGCNSVWNNLGASRANVAVELWSRRQWQNASGHVGCRSFAQSHDTARNSASGLPAIDPNRISASITLASNVSCGASWCRRSPFDLWHQRSRTERRPSKNPSCRCTNTIFERRIDGSSLRPLLLRLHGPALPACRASSGIHREPLTGQSTSSRFGVRMWYGIFHILEIPALDGRPTMDPNTGTTWRNPHCLLPLRRNVHVGAQEFAFGSNHLNRGR